MSLDTIDKIARNAREVLDALTGIKMRFEVANEMDANLRSISKLVEDVKQEDKDFRAAARDVIEGLLANWPHSEIASYYTPENKPVLTKDAALRMASAYLKHDDIEILT